MAGEPAGALLPWLDRLRQQYPGGLLCAVCLRIVATRPESYARSGLPEAQRLAYVCAECQAEDAHRARLDEVSRANLARARAARQAGHDGGAEGVTETPCDHLAEPASEPPSRVTENRGVADIGFRYSGSDALTTASRRLRRDRRGGRPPRHATPAEGHRARQRAYRERQRRARPPGLPTPV